MDRGTSPQSLLVRASRLSGDVIAGVRPEHGEQLVRRAPKDDRPSAEFGPGVSIDADHLHLDVPLSVSEIHSEQPEVGVEAPAGSDATHPSRSDPYLVPSALKPLKMCQGPAKWSVRSPAAHDRGHRLRDDREIHRR